MIRQLRVARPVSDLQRSVTMYQAGLGLYLLGQFEDHDGFDGAMLGQHGAPYHLELTYRRSDPVTPTPSAEDLLVLYIPDEGEWVHACNAMLAAGFQCVPSVNPYWDAKGRTYVDADGYRTVLKQSKWGM